MTIEEAAQGRATLTAMLVALLVGGAILLPALAYLYLLFQRSPRDNADGDTALTGRAPAER